VERKPNELIWSSPYKNYSITIIYWLLIIIAFKANVLFIRLCLLGLTILTLYRTEISISSALDEFDK